MFLNILRGLFVVIIARTGPIIEIGTLKKASAFIAQNSQHSNIEIECWSLDECLGTIEMN
jgi:hypothetical protein